MLSKKLHKIQEDKVLFGVCGGIAEYLDTDSTIVRIIFILIALGYGSGILIYLILAIVMPSPSEIEKE